MPKGKSGDAIIDWMVANNVPVTRDEWIRLNWGDDVPDPWTDANEMELPEQLRDWSLFNEVDGVYEYKGKRK